MDLKLYQSEVGRQLGVSKDCVTNWENGRNEPLISYYPRIISFLGYNPFANGKNTVGAKILAYRIEKGLSAKKFGALVGLQGCTILDIETDSTSPRKETMDKIQKIVML